MEAQLALRGPDLELGALRRLFKFKYLQANPFAAHGFAVAPDWRRFIITQPEEEFSTLNLMVNWTAAIRK